MTYKINYNRFTLVFLGMTIGMPILLMLVNALTGLELQNAGSTIIPMMIAAMVEGQGFARTDARRPTNGEAWMISFRLTAVALILSFVLAIVVKLLWPEIIASVPSGWWVIVSVAIAVIFVLVARIFLALGAKTALRAIEKSGK